LSYRALYTFLNFNVNYRSLFQEEDWW